ncbi:hypothetical protein H5410_032420 [Solanum commersonii]|uniref:Uncharacterized protein n=1 Tax=Solanum commersonii TaxID=4109 RepID=A0A9J5YKY4_SOLCO|nr:hypothetical protein H5410_032420 [Solanum commersonii]
MENNIQNFVEVTGAWSSVGVSRWWLDCVRDLSLEEVERVDFGCFRLGFCLPVVFELLIGGGSSEMETRRREGCGGSLEV